MNTTYEWDVESVDKSGDILGHFHADKLTDYPSWMGGTVEPDGRHQLTLIRETGNKYHGLSTREWAYAEHDSAGLLVLPKHTDDGHKVPQRYHKELREWRPKA